MTKWARMRKLKEKRRGVETPKISESEEKTTKLVEPEKISNNAKRSQENHSPETPTTFKSTSVLAQIPRYVYLAAIFLLLSGIFFPLITSGADGSYGFIIGGVATLFLGLAGGILLFKATTSYNWRGTFLVIGFALIAISLALVILIPEWWKSEFHIAI